MPVLLIRRAHGRQRCARSGDDRSRSLVDRGRMWAAALPEALQGFAGFAPRHVGRFARANYLALTA